VLNATPILILVLFLLLSKTHLGSFESSTAHELYLATKPATNNNEQLWSMATVRNNNSGVFDATTTTFPFFSLLPWFI